MSLAPGMAYCIMQEMNAGRRDIALQNIREWPGCLAYMPEQYRERLKQWRQDAEDAAEDARFDRSLAVSVRVPEGPEAEAKQSRAAVGNVRSSGKQRPVFGRPETGKLDQSSLV